MRRVVLLLALSAAAELLTIGSVLPFLALLVGQDLHTALGEMAGAWPALEGVSRDALVVTTASVIIVAAVLSAVLHVLLTRASQTWIHDMGHDLSVEVYARRLQQSYEDFVRGHSSEILATLDQIQALVTAVLAPALRALISAVVALVIVALLMVVNFRVAVAVLALTGLLYGVIVLLTRPRLERSASVFGELFRARVKSVQEGMGGVRDVMIDRRQHVFVKEFSDIERRFRDVQISTGVISAAPQRVVEATGIVLIVGIALVLSRGEGGAMSAIPQLGTMALGFQRLLPRVQQIYQARSQFATYGRLVGHINALLQVPVACQAPKESSSDIAFGDRVCFDRVSYTHPDSEHATLEEIELVIERGERIALTGPSGSGKSTLIDLLMGLLRPQKGRITIDGTELDEDVMAAWQSRIAHVPQSIFLLDGSIFRNIAFGQDAREVDSEDVRTAARAAEVDAFIKSLPEGYATRVGEHGVMLSGGQQQRIGLARALFKRPDVLVLDEATSALDEATEAAVLTSLEKLGSEITVVCVAHRRSTLEAFPRMIRLEAGRVALDVRRDVASTGEKP